MLEHLPDDEKALSEMQRALNSGGELIVEVPNRYSAIKVKNLFAGKESHPYENLGHLREYSLTSIKSLLHKFSLTRIEARTTAPYMPFLGRLWKNY